MKLSQEHKNEVLGAIKNGRSWECFRDFVELQKQAKKNEIRAASSDLTKLLAREQAMGQLVLLEAISEDFHNHVVNVIETQTTS